MRVTAPDSREWWLLRRLAVDYPRPGGAELTAVPEGEEDWRVADIQLLLRLPWLAAYPFRILARAAQARWRREPYLVEARPVDGGEERLRRVVPRWRDTRRARDALAAEIAGGTAEAAPPASAL